MLRFVFFLVFLTLSLQGETLDSLISKALQSHGSLKAIEQKLSSLDEAQKLTQNFSNPEFSLSVSDVQLDDPTNRSLEPMQYTAINFKQKIPYFGKRDKASDVVKAQKSVLFHSLQEARVNLAKEIRLTAYSIWEQSKRVEIIEEYVELSSRNVELSNAYSASGELHFEIMNAELALSALKVKKSRINSDIKALYSKLSYLSGIEVLALNEELQIGSVGNEQAYLEDLQFNRAYRATLSRIEEKSHKAKLKELDSIPDPYVSVGYFYREAFEDYLSFSIGSALPVYGSESLATQKLRKETLQEEYASNDFYERLKVKLSSEHAKLQSSYETYLILNDESIPELEHMIELTDSMLKNGKSLIFYMKLLEKRLNLYERKYIALASFKRAEAKLQALQGEI